MQDKSVALKEQKGSSLLLEVTSLVKDPVFKVQIWLERQGAFKKESKCVTINSRASTLDEDIKREVEANPSYKLDFTHKAKLPIALNEKEKSLLKMEFYQKSLEPKRKLKIESLVKDFLLSFNLYGKNTEDLKVMFYEKLSLYPVKYLEKILDCNFFKQKELPSLYEIEEALRFCDSEASEMFYQISNFKIVSSEEFF